MAAGPASFLSVVGLLLLSSASWADSYYSVTYTKRSQLKISMEWIGRRASMLAATSVDVPAHDGSRRYQGRGEVTDKSLMVTDADSRASLPFSAIGKLFFEKADGSISTCSAAFVSSPLIVATAAHCVMDLDGNWHKDFIFVRNFGTSQQEVYGISCLGIPAGWGDLMAPEAFKHDYAFLKSAQLSHGAALGLSASPPPAELQLVGFANNYYRGNEMLSINLSTIRDQAEMVGTSENPLGVGSSGMPWLSMTTAYSVSSHYRSDEIDIMWGPRFNADTLALLDYVKNDCQD